MLALALSLGCASDAPPPSRDVAVRDSAGIRIVENVDVAGRISGWSVGPEPILRIGWAEGDPELQFVRSGFVDGDRVVFGDMQSLLIYVFSLAGEPIATLGGKGEGPGELGRLDGIIPVSADTFIVVDSGNLRISFFAGTDLARDTRFEYLIGSAGYTPRARARDGSYVLVPTMFRERDLQGDERWASYPILHTADFSVMDTVAIVPLLEMTGFNSNPNMGFGRVVLAGERLAAGTNDRAEIRWMGLDGHVQQIATWDRVATPVTDADRDAWGSAYRARLEGRLEPAQLEELLDRALGAFAGTVPLFGTMYGDDRGDVWLSRQEWGVQAPATYDVVAASGEWLGEVGFPRPIRILDITDDRVLGVETDDFDVQSVVLYSLEKPE